MELTATQSRYLDEIRRDGERSYNGHARRPLVALAEAGLIRLSYEAALLNGRGKDIYRAKAVAADREEER